MSYRRLSSYIANIQLYKHNKHKQGSVAIEEKKRSSVLIHIQYIGMLYQHATVVSPRNCYKSKNKEFKWIHKLFYINSLMIKNDSSVYTEDEGQYIATIALLIYIHTKLVLTYSKNSPGFHSCFGKIIHNIFYCHRCNSIIYKIHKFSFMSSSYDDTPFFIPEQNVPHNINSS